MDERLERHLCNLHNEVFEAAESRINTEVPSLYVRVYRTKMYSIFITTRSLTIREGISVCLLFLVPCPVFPHYT